MDSKSSLINSYGFRQIPNLQLGKACVLLDRRCDTVRLDRWQKCRQRNELYHGWQQGNQHCDAESFSSKQLICHDFWAMAGIRCNVMEELSFCLNEEEIRYPLTSGVWAGEQCCSHKGLSTKYLGEKDRNFLKPQLWRFGNCMDEAMCREAEWNLRGPKGPNRARPLGQQSYSRLQRLTQT